MVGKFPYDSRSFGNQNGSNQHVRISTTYWSLTSKPEFLKTELDGLVSKVCFHQIKNLPFSHIMFDFCLYFCCILNRRWNFVLCIFFYIQFSLRPLIEQPATMLGWQRVPSWWHALTQRDSSALPRRDSCNTDKARSPTKKKLTPRQ